VWARGVQR